MIMTMKPKAQQLSAWRFTWKTLEPENHPGWRNTRAKYWPNKLIPGDHDHNNAAAWRIDNLDKLEAEMKHNPDGLLTMILEMRNAYNGYLQQASKADAQREQIRVTALELEQNLHISNGERAQAITLLSFLGRAWLLLGKKLNFSSTVCVHSTSPCINWLCNIKGLIAFKSGPVGVQIWSVVPESTTQTLHERSAVEEGKWSGICVMLRIGRTKRHKTQIAFVEINYLFVTITLLLLVPSFQYFMGLSRVFVITVSSAWS